MIFKEKKGYLFVLSITTTLIIGPLQISHASQIFFDRYIIEIRPAVATTHILSENKYSDLRIALLTDGLFSDTGWGAFAYNAAQSLEIEYGYDIDFRENVAIPDRSEERRVGKECRSRWSPY